jgi:large subunit ribosomal protein L16
VAVVKRGRILFELAGVNYDLAKEAMRLASHKLPFDTRLVIRETAAGASVKKELVPIES